MHVKLRNPSAVIKEINEFDLLDFSVLIGRNGVGKTQILRRIAGGGIEVDGLTNANIELYDIDSFQPNVPEDGKWEDSKLFHETIENYFYSKSGTPLIETARKKYHDILDEWEIKGDTEKCQKFNEAVREIIESGGDFGTLGSVKGDNSVVAYFNAIQNDVFQKLGKVDRNTSPRKNSKLTTLRGRFYNSPQALLCQAMRLSNKLPHDLCREDVHRATHYEGYTIGNQLSQIFARYKVDQFEWAFTESGKSDKSVKSLMDQYRDLHRPPWEALREVIDRVRESYHDPELFNFEFSDPENDVLNFYKYQEYSFTTKLTNRGTGNSYSVTELSSGEKIILALCLTAFNRGMGRYQPGLILLDEIDALLHPSMISILIDFLKEMFVRNGTRVVMATHSITTVSMLDEGEIFQMIRSGSRVEVKPVTRTDAIAELSEGLATIDAGLRIMTSLSAAKITILTEGNNALHLKKWAKLFFPDEVEVFDNIPRGRSGQNQLKSYGQFFSMVQTNTHILIVWDWDAKKVVNCARNEYGNASNVTVFAFSHRKNSKFKGIENKYEENLIQPFLTTSSYAGNTFKSLSDKGKNDFASHVYSSGTREYFVHFEDLKEEVEKILRG